MSHFRRFLPFLLLLFIYAPHAQAGRFICWESGVTDGEGSNHAARAACRLESWQEGRTATVSPYARELANEGTRVLQPGEDRAIGWESGDLVAWLMGWVLRWLGF